MPSVHKVYIINNWHGWFLPSAFFFLLPFESLLYVPLVIMSLMGCIAFLRKEVRMVFRGNDTYRLLIYIFLLIWLPMLFSLTDAINPGHSIKTTLLLLPYLFVGFFILFHLASPDTRSKLQLAILIITSFWCLDALFQLSFGVDLLGNTYIKRDRLSGIFYPKYTLGLVLAVLMPVVLEQLKRLTKNYAGLFFAIVIASIHVAVIILSGSRNALIMLVIGMSGWFFYTLYIHRKVNWRRLILVVAISIPIITFLSLQQPTRHDSLVNERVIDLKTLDKVSNHRLPLWEAAARMSLDHWINGIGPRGFRHAYNDYRPVEGKYDIEFPHGSTHPHFALLEIMAETGLFGLIGIIFLIFILFTRLKELAADQKLEACPWFLGVTLAIVPNIAKAFYSSFWMSIIMCMIFIGMASTADKKRIALS